MNKDTFNYKKRVNFEDRLPLKTGNVYRFPNKLEMSYIGETEIPGVQNTFNLTETNFIVSTPEHKRVYIHFDLTGYGAIANFFHEFSFAGEKYKIWMYEKDGTQLNGHFFVEKL